MASKTPRLSAEVMEYLRVKGLTIESFLGRGGYSSVYKAISGSNQLAVKVIKLREQPKEILNQYLPQEIEIASSVEHRCIMKTHRIFKYQNDYIFMVSDFANGGDLITILDKGIPLDEGTVRNWFAQIVEAVVYLHTIGVAHRDIKPDNVLIHDGFAKLTDFGYARQVNDSDGNGCLTTSSCGTYEYLSPEQIVCILEEEAYDPFLSDCYSLGVLLFLMITLEFPYECERTDDINSDLKNLLKNQRKQNWILSKNYRNNRNVFSLLKQLLNPDVRARIRSFQISTHPWFQS